MGNNKDIRQEKHPFFRFPGGSMVLIVLAVLSGILVFLGMELVNGDFAQMKFPLGLGNLLVIWFLVLLFFALTNSLKAGILIPAFLLLLFSAASYFTCLFRGVPLLAPDLLVVRTALSVAGRFSYTIAPRLWVFIGGVVLLAVIVVRFPRDIRLHGRGRKICLLAAAGAIAVFSYVFAFSNTLEKAGVVVSHFNPVRSYAENGSILTFARSAQMIRQVRPEGYTPEAVEELAETYREKARKDTKTYRKPNVIVIVNEAFSDLQSIGSSFETSEDVMPVIHGLTENTVKGTAYTSVFGGYTANSEYEFLTGHSMSVLNGVSPFQFLIKKPLSSLATLLDSRGYAGLLAIHPYIKTGYQRPLAYKNLGFADFRALEDMDDREHEYLRGYISDSDDAKEVTAAYEKTRKTTDAPVFLYNMTMQNHAPFDGEDEGFTADIRVKDEDLATAALENYLSLIKRSDAALGELIEYFSAVEEDTVIIFFGDHEPKLGNSFYKKLLGKKPSKLEAEESMQRYEVPYVIWTNYDIEGKDYGEISLNYLAAVAADAAGMEPSPFQRYLMDLREELPVITAQGYWDKDHVFYETGADSPWLEALRLYEYVQYNNLTDGKNRAEDFFR